MNLDMDSRLFQPVNNFRVVAFEHGVDLISGLCDCFIYLSHSHVQLRGSHCHLQLSTAHWVIPGLSEWFLRLLGPLIRHLRSNFIRISTA